MLEDKALLAFTDSCDRTLIIRIQVFLITFYLNMYNIFKYVYILLFVTQIYTIHIVICCS
ncbi:hypothetical protein BMETH_334011781244, partial [methanotrophic bacterial endosymbiont of Bathymodiolus sp.]